MLDGRWSTFDQVSICQSNFNWPSATSKMTREETFAFLKAKCRLISPHIDVATAQIFEVSVTHYGGKINTISEKSWPGITRSMDAAFDKAVVEYMVDEDKTAVRSELIKQFGFASFGEEPEKVLKRILREGKILSEEEAKLVSDFIAGSYLGWTEGRQKMERFIDIFHAYERKS